MTPPFHFSIPFFTIYFSIFICCISISYQGNSQLVNKNSFIRAKGTSLIDKNGNPILLKGVCFGNEVWSDNTLPYTHHTEDDFVRVNDMGMNVIRFYMNYKTFEDDANPYQYKKSGWEWLEQNIEWSKKHKIYLILNMHVPQGGFQSIGEGGSLWTVPENQKRLKALWNQLAKRYANEPYIAGFDLVNEPVTTESKAQWQTLAQALIDTIRTVDRNHLLIVERLNAIGNNWNSDNEMNFFLVKDTNVAYTFHFYAPITYSHQNTSWTGLGEGGRYPDPSLPSVKGNPTWYSATFDNPNAPKGSYDWTYLQGKRFTINDTVIKLAMPTIVAQQLGKVGMFYVDDLELKEYDEKGTYVRTVCRISPSSDKGWYFWSQNNSGNARFSSNVGHQDQSSLVLESTSSDANYGNYENRFIPIQGFAYELSGWVKGNSVARDAVCKLRIDFQTTSTPVYGRTKEYLASELAGYLSWGKNNNVPLYCGEFGLYKDCYTPEKGGIQWLNDCLSLFTNANLSFTYHSYHEDAFGIYPGYGTLLNPTLGRTEVIELFKRILK